MITTDPHANSSNHSQQTRQVPIVFTASAWGYTKLYDRVIQFFIG